MKKIEKLLLKAYRMGQDSVSYMKMTNSGKAKINISSFDLDGEKPQKQIPKDEITTTTEDEMLKEILK